MQNIYKNGDQCTKNRSRYNESNYWWMNQVENEYHVDVSDAVTVVEGNSYTISYVIDMSLSLFASGGQFSMDVRVGDAGWGWGFDVLSGEV